MRVETDNRKISKTFLWLNNKKFKNIKHTSLYLYEAQNVHELYNMRGRDLKVYEMNVYFQIQIHKKYGLWFTSRVKMPCNIKIMKPVMGVYYDSALMFHLWIMTFRISEYRNRVHFQPKSHFKCFHVYAEQFFRFQLEDVKY